MEREIEELKDRNVHLELALTRSKGDYGNSNELTEHLRTENRSLRLRSESLSALTTDLRSQLEKQANGVANLKWQLRQKEIALKALETRLEETFPVDEDNNKDSNDEINDESPMRKRRRKNASIVISERGM